MAKILLDCRVALPQDFISWFNGFEPIEQEKWLEKPAIASECGKALREVAKRIKEQEDAAMLSRITKIKKSVAAYYKDRYYIYYRYIIKYYKKYNIRECTFLIEVFDG